MSAKKYEKKIELQEKLILKQSEQIKSLKLEVNDLRLKCEEKDNLINSTSSLRNELIENVSKIKKHEEEYKELNEELRKMKEIINQTVYKGKWWLVKFLIK